MVSKGILSTVILLTMCIACILSYTTEKGNMLTPPPDVGFSTDMDISSRSGGLGYYEQGADLPSSPGYPLFPYQTNDFDIFSGETDTDATYGMNPYGHGPDLPLFPDYPTEDDDDDGSGSFYPPDTGLNLFPTYSTTPDDSWSLDLVPVSEFDGYPGLQYGQPPSPPHWTYEDFLTTDIATFNKDDFQRKIMKFDNAIQKNIVSIQLRYCPYIGICSVNALVDELPLLPDGVLSLDPDATHYQSCCKECSCDYNICSRYGTCCPDILQYPNKQSVALDESKDADSIIGTVTDNGKTKQSCVSLQFGSSSDTDGLYAIDRCPDPTHQLSDKCTRDYTPAIDTLADIVPCYEKLSLEIYRNKYCAYCNGLSDDDLEYFEPALRCTLTPQLDDISDVRKLMHFADTNEHCYIKFDPAGKFNSRTCRLTRDQCNVTGLWTEYSLEVDIGCRSYESVIWYDSYFYRNIFCVICNGFYNTSYDSECVDTGAKSPGLTYSFSGLLKIEENQAEDQRCSRNELYHPREESCVKISCVKNFVAQNGKCEFMFTNLSESTKVAYKFHLELEPVVDKTLREFDTFGAMEYVERFILSQGGSMDYLNMYCIVYVMESVNINSSYVHSCQMDLTVKAWSGSHEEVFLQNLQELDESFIPPNRFQTVSQNSEFFVKIIPRRRDLLIEYMHHIEKAKSLDIVMVGRKLSSEFDRFDPSIPQPIVIDVESTASCPVVQALAHDIVRYDKEQENLTLAGDHVITKGAWYSDDNDIFICSKEYQSYLDTLLIGPKDTNSSGINAEMVVSVICVPLSILALSVTIFTYLVHENLRHTLPGKNLISLSVSLMLAQSLYLVSNFSGLEAKSISCKVMGALVHFSWLFSFFSMNVCTFHMFRVLTKTQLSTKRSGLKRFLLYLLYSTSASMLFVVANVVTAESTLGHIGYGQQTCYISSQIMLYFTFVLPLAAVILSNLGMFVAVIIKIKQTSEVSRNVKNERNNLVIFAKLSTITGITWILGFIYLWTDIKAFSYLFIIFNASQGVFICFAFIVNKRVLGMYRELTNKDKSISVTRNTPVQS